MEKCVLVVAFDSEKCKILREECRKHSVFVSVVMGLDAAVKKLVEMNNLLLIILLPGILNNMDAIRIIRDLTGAPILVVQDQYDGTEKIASIEAGADEYIQWPDSISEGLASARALIRRYTFLNPEHMAESRRFPKSGILINSECRRVYINMKEIRFPRKEFDLFCLLASNPGRVFTNEQLYREIWGDEYRSSDNGLNSCLRRIRRKLDEVPGEPCRIENRRGVGYCFIA